MRQASRTATAMLWKMGPGNGILQLNDVILVQLNEVVLLAPSMTVPSFGS